MAILCYDQEMWLLCYVWCQTRRKMSSGSGLLLNMFQPSQDINETTPCLLWLLGWHHFGHLWFTSPGTLVLPGLITTCSRPALTPAWSPGAQDICDWCCERGCSETEFRDTQSRLETQRKPGNENRLAGGGWAGTRWCWSWEWESADTHSVPCGAGAHARSGDCACYQPFVGCPRSRARAHVATPAACLPPVQQPTLS